MNDKGFSLIELIIVVVIIGIIAAIAVPNFLAARRSASQASAVSSIRLISSAQETYQITTGTGNFGSLVQLRNDRLIDDVLATGAKSGYTYSITTFNSTSTNPSVFNAYANAAIFGTSPVSTGSRNYYVNESGTIYENSAGQDNPPDATSNTDRTIVNGTPLAR
ncbi:MAG: prepilin-type N-terminal cleavage/methylation domain-containing protein [Pyrinomonadaceae bacterium]|nr:prepilin-type N-terminal cleavage/methylation domain-containing protein [Pyrinomonadaceae bacterium]